jgi:hypothetical protein
MFNQCGDFTPLLGNSTKFIEADAVEEFVYFFEAPT